jgi:hypothetical protein
MIPYKKKPITKETGGELKVKALSSNSSTEETAHSTISK